jgi:hypothetical protein
MKVIRYVAMGLACSALSAAAYGATTPSTKSCVDSFIAEGLENRPADVRIRKEYVPPMPLVLRMEMPMQLTAVEKDTGRTIATGACDPQRGLVEVKKH